MRTWWRCALAASCLLSMLAAGHANTPVDKEGAILRCHGRHVRVLLCDDENHCIGLDPTTGKLRHDEGIEGEYLALDDHDDLDDHEPGLTPEQAELTQEIEWVPRRSQYVLTVAGIGVPEAQYQMEVVWYSPDYDDLGRQDIGPRSIRAGEQHVYSLLLDRTRRFRLVITRQEGAQ